MKDHPYYNEVKFAIELFETNGFSLEGYDDGGGIAFEDDTNVNIEGVLSVDESEVYMEFDGYPVRLFFVLGNEPGVAICDYHCNKDIDHLVEDIISMVYSHFN